MKKKWTPAVAAVLAAGVMFSGEGITFAAQVESTPYNALASKKENQGQAQQFKSIDKQLDKIEEKLLQYKEKMNKIKEEQKQEESDETPAETPVEAPSEEEAPAEEETSAEAPSEEEAPAEEETPAEAPSEEEAPDTEEIITASTNSAEETELAGEETGNNDNSISEEDKEEKEVEKDLEGQSGYRGKFQALENRLNALTKQVTSLSSKGADTEAVAERQARIASLKQEVQSVLASIGQIEEEIQAEIKADKAVKEKAPKKDISLTKGWTIKFSKSIDANTLSTLDIVVMDAEGSLVETTFTYSEETKSITITPLHPYQKGTVYTLYIGKDIQGTDGVPLKNTVKMDFTTEADATEAASVKAAGFSDVPDRYQEAVQAMVDQGITSGVGAGKFGVDQQIKRIDAAVMLAKALKLELDAAPDSGFKDVPKRAQKAVNALVKAGILSGKTATTFGADQTLTRGELAIILTRAFKLSGNSETLTFKDVPARYEASVKAMVANGITKGKTATAFGTADPVKRGEFAVLFHNIQAAE
ncbi:S-layer homology domain-containing protein [Domibacillus sp. PGB-M46]|uniref:S-layer homology domain-containing protein n=1 Tax=Domibacillus sp. PGB-M46 TaxID=2910255 RepID=UPI001F5A879B|nr:S-layer homology domain-containing protein [Domibacillus sp. PGB-M46]MCI2253093.1 S-layer homology domain-containing protein [Domibacillus sp. PGB-M46]